jgi:hypothetical protein
MLWAYTLDVLVLCYREFIAIETVVYSDEGSPCDVLSLILAVLINLARRFLP